MTLIFNDENKRAHTLPRSSTHTHILSVLCAVAPRYTSGSYKNCLLLIDIISVVYKCIIVVVHTWMLDSHLKLYTVCHIFIVIKK